jgi:hypothetical protein
MCPDRIGNFYVVNRCTDIPLFLPDPKKIQPHVSLKNMSSLKNNVDFFLLGENGNINRFSKMKSCRNFLRVFLKNRLFVYLLKIKYYKSCEAFLNLLTKKLNTARTMGLASFLD